MQPRCLCGHSQERGSNSDPPVVGRRFPSSSMQELRRILVTGTDGYYIYTSKYTHDLRAMVHVLSPCVYACPSFLICASLCLRKTESQWGVHLLLPAAGRVASHLRELLRRHLSIRGIYIFESSRDLCCRRARNSVL